MKKVFLFVAVIAFLAAGSEPTVRVDEGVLVIGNTRVQLPPDLYAYQNKSTGDISISQRSQTFDRRCEAGKVMVGLDFNNMPICGFASGPAK